MMETESDSSYIKDSTEEFSFRPFTSKGVVLNLENFPGDVIIAESQFLQNMLNIKGLYYTVYEPTTLLSKTAAMNDASFYQYW